MKHFFYTVLGLVMLVYGLAGIWPPQAIEVFLQKWEIMEINKEYI